MIFDSRWGGFWVECKQGCIFVHIFKLCFVHWTICNIFKVHSLPQLIRLLDNTAVIKIRLHTQITGQAVDKVGA